MKKRILVLLAAGFEELELVAPVDLLRRAGGEVVLATVEESDEVIGRNGIRLLADTYVSVVDLENFDMLLIPGGPGVGALRRDGRAAAIAKSFVSGGKTIGAICAAPLILADAGLLAGRRFTAHYSVAEELPSYSPGAAVVEDGFLITSRGAGTSIAFGLALVKRLYGQAASENIAESIMYLEEKRA